MYDDAAAASSVGHDIFSWLHVAQLPDTTFDALADSQGRPTLDIKLGPALRKLFKSDLKQQAQTKANAIERQGRMLRDRQILWLLASVWAGRSRGNVVKIELALVLAPNVPVQTDGEVGMVAQHRLQPVVGDTAVEMVHVMHSDVDE